MPEASLGAVSEFAFLQLKGSKRSAPVKTRTCAGAGLGQAKPVVRARDLLGLETMVMARTAGNKGVSDVGTIDMHRLGPQVPANWALSIDGFEVKTHRVYISAVAKSDQSGTSTAQIRCSADRQRPWVSGIL